MTTPRLSIKPGDVVKVAAGGERFWTVVVRVNDDADETVEATVNNALVFCPWPLHHKIAFPLRAIIAIWSG